MKKGIVTLLFLLPVLMFAQQEFADELLVPGDQPSFWTEVDEADSLYYGSGGVVGAITIDGVTYSQIRFRQELALGKFGLAVDLDLLVDSDGKIRKDDWDEWQDYLGKVFYIRYGRRKDFIYFKTGSISDYTLGQGLIFNNYSNMLRYPDEKNIGSYFGMNLKEISGLGFEIYTHDLFRNQILAGRVHVNPFQFLKIPFVKDLTVGANVGWDRNQLGKFPDSDGDGIPDIYDSFPNDPNYAADTDGDGIPDEDDWDVNGNGVIDGPRNPAVEATFPDIYSHYPTYQFDNDFVTDFLMEYKKKQPVAIYGFDYEIPVMDTDNLKLSHYAEVAQIRDHGVGFVFPGFGAKFWNMEAKLEFRRFGANFLPSYFDRIYERKRSEMIYEEKPESDSTDALRKYYWLRTKDQVLDNINPSLGWFGFLQANFWEVVTLKMAYQDMYGKDLRTGKSLWTKLSVIPKMVPRLKLANFYYSQVNAPYINFRYPRTSCAHVAGELVYEIAPNANLIGRYSETYTDLNNDGRISGRKEINEILTFGVEFVF